MQSSLEKRELPLARLQGAPAFAPDGPQRRAHELYRAISQRALEVPPDAAVGPAVRDLRRGAPVSNRKSYFARLLRALHYSRRLEAASVMRRYGYLLQGGGEASQSNQPEIAKQGRLDMASGDYPCVPPAKPLMWFNVRTLTIIAVVGFGILHLIAGTIVSRASHDRPAESSSTGVRGD
jgi:hypothetical protein